MSTFGFVEKPTLKLGTIPTKRTCVVAPQPVHNTPTSSGVSFQFVAYMLILTFVVGIGTGIGFGSVIFKPCSDGDSIDE